MKKGKKAYNLMVLALTGLFSLGGCTYSVDGSTLPVKVESQREVNSYDCEEFVTDLLERYESTVDYDNQDYRFLVYLYSMALSNTSFDELKNQTENDCFAYALVNNVDSEFVKQYITNGKIDFDKVISALSSYEMDIDHVRLIQEANVCLRSDLYEKNIDGIKYDEFLSSLVVKLKENEELYSEWYGFHEENESMYEDEKLFEKVIALK